MPIAKERYNCRDTRTDREKGPIDRRWRSKRQRATEGEPASEKVHQAADIYHRSPETRRLRFPLALSEYACHAERQAGPIAGVRINPGARANALKQETHSPGGLLC